MSGDPQDIAQELWTLIQSGGREVIDQADSTLVGELRDSLGLPELPKVGTPITIPARDPGAAVVLEPGDEHYAVRAGSAAELPVAIETRKGVLVVDADDPLAQARRSIESLEAIEF
jgi:hypothetical protein